MAKLIYSAIASLDGYVVVERGQWDWSFPDREVLAAFNDLERPVGTHLYGRRMYEVLVAWETIDVPEPLMRDYAEIWRGAEKIVYSSTLEEVSSARTRIERRFDPEAVRELKRSADRDLAIGGPTLATEAFAAGLVDQVHLFDSPVIVGGGTPALPDGVRLYLALVDERRFGNGVVHLAYRAQS